MCFGGCGRALVVSDVPWWFGSLAVVEAMLVWSFLTNCGVRLRAGRLKEFNGCRE
jgi:hypothetical protein